MKLALTFAALLPLGALAAAPDATPPKPHPLAPSLPQLTKEEEDKLDGIVARFVLYDIGQLKGPEGEKALQDFQKLGPAAFFALVRGFNQAITIEGSCPALVIGKKLHQIIRSSNDGMLLEFARENIGGEHAKRHAGLVRDLRTAILLRRREAASNPAAPYTPSGNSGKIVLVPRSQREKTLAAMPIEELLKAIESEKDPAKLKELFTALDRRPKGGVAQLGKLAASAADSDIRLRAFEQLVKQLARQPVETVRDYLNDPLPPVRSAAALVVGDRNLRYVEELIGLLEDEESEVRQSARKALTQLTNQDFGPEVFCTPEERAAAVKKWREWQAKSGQ